MRRLAQFCLVGASGVVVDMGVLALLAHRTSVPLVLAKALACELAIVNNFVWNDVWTFHGADLGTSRFWRFVRFNGVALAGLALNVLLFQAQVVGLGLNLYLSNAVAIGLVAGFNYTLSRHWAWRVRTNYSCPATMKLVGRDSVHSREFAFISGPQQQITAKLRVSGRDGVPESSFTRERVAVGLALAGSLVLRLSCFPFVSGDMRGDMIPWSEIIEREGAWQALGQDFSNYPPLYLYLLTLATWLPLPRLFAIKLVYVAFDYVLAAYVAGIAERCGKGRWFWPAMMIILCLPTVLMNSALWGQCDAMYASGLVACVHYLLAGRPVGAMVAFGLASSLKPQAVFLAPLILLLVWQRRFSPLLLYVPAAVYVVFSVPACLAGRSCLDLLLLYVNQRILPFPALTLGATNLYQWLPGVPFEPFFKAGLALAGVSAVAYGITLARRFPAGLNAPVLLHAALLSLVLIPFVLPAMHERYFFAADALAVAYGFAFQRGWVVAALIQTASAFTYLPYLFNWEPVPRPLLAVLMAVALGRLWWDLTARSRPTRSAQSLATARVLPG